MNIQFTPRFRHAYKKIIKKDQNIQFIFHERMNIFSENPNDARLKNHALTGRLAGTRSISIAYDLRALFYFEDETFVFFDIGTHDDVY